MRSTLIQSPGTTLCRIRAEYWEMPGLKLTAVQAQRLLGLDPALCETLLGELVGTGFLAHTSDGEFVRRDRSSVA